MPRSLDREARAAGRSRRGDGRGKASVAGSRAPVADIDYDAAVDLAIKAFWSRHAPDTLPSWFDECAALGGTRDAYGRWLVDVSLRQPGAVPLIVFRVAVTRDGTEVLVDCDLAELNGADYERVVLVAYL